MLQQCAFECVPNQPITNKNRSERRIKREENNKQTTKKEEKKNTEHKRRRNQTTTYTQPAQLLNVLCNCMLHDWSIYIYIYEFWNETKKQPNDWTSKWDKTKT